MFDLGVSMLSTILETMDETIELNSNLLREQVIQIKLICSITNKRIKVNDWLWLRTHNKLSL
jgi:hypothetical protein